MTYKKNSACEIDSVMQRVAVDFLLPIHKYLLPAIVGCQICV